jgi:DNA mismatch endonuclease (patch repair protein)
MQENRYGASLRVTGRRDTQPELALRSALHRAGLRYRVDYRVGKGRSAPRPDIAFPRLRIAIFVDGCFWHQCPEHGVMPKSNQTFWEPKLRANVARDVRQTQRLQNEGWLVIRVWEHEQTEAAAARIQTVVAGRRQP